MHRSTSSSERDFSSAMARRKVRPRPMRRTSSVERSSGSALITMIHAAWMGGSSRTPCGQSGAGRAHVALMARDGLPEDRIQ